MYRAGVTVNVNPWNSIEWKPLGEKAHKNTPTGFRQEQRREEDLSRFLDFI